jgi:xylulokinase
MTTKFILSTGLKGYDPRQMRAASWLGLDFGTSSVKALLVRGDGSVAGRASAAYPTSYAPGGVAEQEGADYLRAARQAIAACGAHEMPLRGIGLAGQTPTLVPVDGKGEPVRPALTWQDHRADDEARALEGEFGDPLPLFGSRLPWTAAYAPAKLLWLSRHEPETVARTRFVLQPKDYVGLRLTDSPLSDPWSSKGLCHVLTSEAATGVLERVGFDPGVAPPLAPAWERRGAVTSEAAAAFGLPEGAPVSVGWSDAVAAMLAVGAFELPSAFVLSGTSSIVGVTSSRALPAHPRLLELPAACAPLAVHYGPTESSGASIDWLARLLRCEPAEVLTLAASAEPSRSPVFVPYLSGERAPVWRTDIRAVVLGLGSEHGAAELARAVVDGVCLSEADVLAVAEEHTGSAPTAVAVAGRGADAAPWLDARLAALGRPLHLLTEPDASALGAAMLGAAAAEGSLSAARPLRGRVEVVAPATGSRPSSARLARFRQAAQASQSWQDTDVCSSQQ